MTNDNSSADQTDEHHGSTDDTPLEGGGDTLHEDLTPAVPVTIYPLVADEGNRQLLCDWLDQHDTYQVANTDVPFEDAAFDLCIVDPEAFQTYADELKERKSAAETLLPVLLLLSEDRHGIVEAGRGKLADGVLETTVDEVVSLPIRQMELQWRIQALLRLREQSRELYAQTAELRRFRRAVEASGHAVYITDTDGRIEYVNPAFEETTGYTATEAVGETPQLFHSGEMSEEYYERLWETIGSGSVWEEEIVNRKKNGDLYTAFQTIAPITDEGEVRAFIAVQRDITEYKQLHDELERYREIVERLDDPIMLQDREGQFRLCNDAVAEFAGLPKEELIGEDEFLFMDDATAGIIEGKKREVLETESPVEYELSPSFERTGEDETTFSTQRYPFYNDDGDLVGTIAICRNVTELKQRESELRWYKRAITGTTDLIAAVDEAERYLFANSAYRSHHGVEDRDVTQLTLADVLPESEYRDAEPHVERVLDGETVEYRTTRTHPTQGERTFNAQYYPIEADDGTVVVGVFRDVTETEQRTRQLQVVDNILRHNLRNSLTVIRGEAVEISDQATDAVADSADRIATQAEDLLTTGEKSRAITSILATKPDQRRINLAQTAKAVAQSVASAYETATVTVDVPEQANASATPNIAEAIEELARNAIVHSDRETPSVDVSVHQDDASVRIVVADDGSGLPEMERAVLETGDAVDPLYHGSGLGLWLVYWIVTRSGGTIDVKDVDPRGTKVEIRLPRSPLTQTAA